MHPPTAAALQAGDVVLSHGRYFVLFSCKNHDGPTLSMVAVRPARGPRHRADVEPDQPCHLAIAGLPMAGMLVCCRRVLPMPQGRVNKMGAAAPQLLCRIALAVQRNADAEQIEGTPSVKSTLLALGDVASYGRKVGRQQAT